MVRLAALECSLVIPPLLCVYDAGILPDQLHYLHASLLTQHTDLEELGNCLLDFGEIVCWCKYTLSMTLACKLFHMVWLNLFWFPVFFHHIILFNFYSSNERYPIQKPNYPSNVEFNLDLCTPLHNLKVPQFELTALYTKTSYSKISSHLLWPFDQW